MSIMAPRRPIFPSAWEQQLEDKLIDAEEAFDQVRCLLTAAQKRIAELEAERDEARAAIAWANNSLFGSHGFFLSTNGGPPDQHHLDAAIEKIKAQAGAEWRRAEAAEQSLTAERQRREELEAIATLTCDLDKPFGRAAVETARAAYFRKYEPSK